MAAVMTLGATEAYSIEPIAGTRGPWRQGRQSWHAALSPGQGRQEHARWSQVEMAAPSSPGLKSQVP